MKYLRKLNESEGQIKKISSWKTTDGEIFTKLDQAEYHQENLNEISETRKRVKKNKQLILDRCNSILKQHGHRSRNKIHSIDIGLIYAGNRVISVQKCESDKNPIGVCCDINFKKNDDEFDPMCFFCGSSVET